MNGRIPKKLSEFDIYIKTVTAFIQGASGTSTNGERLGLTTTEIGLVAGILALWFTGNPATPGAYEKHTNPTTKNKATRLAVLNIIKNFKLLFTPYLTRMSGSANITTNDRLMLNIAPPVTTRRTPQSKISDDIYPLIKATGGGNISIMCRTEHDASRGSLAKDSDGVEVGWAIGAPPATAKDAPNKERFSKSKFAIEAGLDNIGKKIFIYVRWINSKHPDIAGDWSIQYSIMIT